MPLELQVKLLRVLESRAVTRVGSTEAIPVDVRVISASNRNLKQAVEAGLLREDLLYRLNVFPIHLPPLRERGDDIVVLAEHFLAALNRREGAGEALVGRGAAAPARTPVAWATCASSATWSSARPS